MHRSSQKKSETQKKAVRLRVLYTILTKENRIGFQGRINHGEVTRKYIGELKEEKLF